jgi:hypothetical protein
MNDEELISVFLEKVTEEHGEVLRNMKKSIEEGKTVFLNTKGGFTPLSPDSYNIISTDTIDSHLFNSVFLKYVFVKEDYQTAFVYYNKQVYFLESKLGCMASHENIIDYYELPANKSCRLVYRINDLDSALGGIEGLSPSYVYDFDDNGERLINNLKKQDLDIIEKFCSYINIS